MEPRPDALEPTEAQEEDPRVIDRPPVDAGDETGEAVSGEASAAELPAAAALSTVATVGRNRARWLIGGGIALAAVAALVFAATLVGARPLPEALKYVPADSAVVVELRPEFPGDQHDKLAALMSLFPGFADQSIFDQKVDEVLGRAVGEASGDRVDYATQVAPLLAGPMALSLTAADLRAATAGGTPTGMLFVATTDGEVTCAVLHGTDAPVTAHRGVEIRSVDRALACAMHGRFMLVGNPEAIERGLDARLDGQGFDGSSTYKTALDGLEGDQLATVFVDGAALAGLVPDALVAFGLDVPDMELPAWTIAGLRAEDDGLVLDALTAPVKGTALASGAPTNAPAAESRFAPVLPADTFGYVEVHGVGAMLAQGLAALRTDPAAAEGFAEVEAALALLGGADNLVGWIEEAGLAVIPTADGVGVAILIRGTDAEATAARVSQVRNLLALAATGTDITVRDAEHGGGTITTVDLGDLGSLLQGLGGMSDLGDIDLGDLGLGDLGDLGNLGDLGVPGDVSNMRAAFAIASRDDLVLITVGDGAAERIFDTDPGSSLEKAPGYVQMIARTGSRNDLQGYIALDAVMSAVEGLASGAELETWKREIAPYAEHIAAIGWSSEQSGAGNRMRFVLTVK